MARPLKPDGVLSHVDECGAAHMADVSAKPLTPRRAVAGGLVHAAPGTISLIAGNAVRKGDVLATARLAGIMAAKSTSEADSSVPRIPLEMIDISLNWSLPRCALTATAGGVAAPAWRWRP
jgi:cyclic pyranopterin phosphate synthase